MTGVGISLAGGTGLEGDGLSGGGSGVASGFVGVCYDFTGADGTLPAGVIEAAGSVEIQDDELVITTGPSSQSVAIFNTVAAVEQWHEVDITIVASNVPRLGALLNGAMTQYLMVAIYPDGDNLEIASHAGSIVDTSFPIQDGDTYRLRVHVVHATDGLIEVWVWRPGFDAEPSATPSIQWAGDITAIVGTPAPSSFVSLFNASGAPADTVLDNYCIYDTDPGWFSEPAFAWPLSTEGDFQPDPALGTGGDELGTWFEPNTTITIVGVRVRNPGGSDAVGTNNRFAKLWYRDGFFNEAIARGQGQDQLPSLWSAIELDQPIVLVAGEPWAVSYNVMSTPGEPDYYFIPAGMADAPFDFGDVTFLSGRFSGSMGNFPDDTFNDNYYGVDILYYAGATVPWNYWVFTTTGSFGVFSEGEDVTLATGFEFETDGNLVGIRLKSPGWTPSGENITIWRVSDESVIATRPLPTLVDGWNRIEFAPVPLVGGVEYRISYDLPAGESYNSLNNAAWANTNTRGPITVQDGYFASSAATFPDTLSGNYYGIDPLWVPD